MAVIKIVNDREASFRGTLEERARLVARPRHTRHWDLNPTATVERKLRFLLEEIGRERKLRRALLRSLLRVECYVGTELIQMEQRTPRYSPYRFPERDKLQRRLGKIEDERRQLLTKYQDRLHGLHVQLLSLLEQHAQVCG